MAVATALPLSYIGVLQMWIYYPVGFLIVLGLVLGDRLYVIFLFVSCWCCISNKHRISISFLFHHWRGVGLVVGKGGGSVVGKGIGSVVGGGIGVGVYPTYFIDWI